VVAGDEANGERTEERDDVLHRCRHGSTETKKGHWPQSGDAAAVPEAG
jgi:hypothetical protein